MTPVTINLYQTSSEPTVVNKTLANETTVSGYFKQVQDISAPVIDLAFDKGTFNTYFNANYAYIEVFHRYYFISRREIGMNNILSIYMDEDVLMSFKNEIYALEPYILRQENKFNEDLFDDVLIPLVKPNYTAKSLNISYPKITGSSSVREVNYDKLNLVEFCNFLSGETTCIAIKIFSDANTGDTYESKWMQNGGTYFNRTYFENIDQAAGLIKYMEGSSFWGSIQQQLFADVSQAFNFVKAIPFDCYKAGLGLVNAEKISIVGAADYKLSDSTNSFMDTQNSFFILSIEPFDLNLRPTMTYLDYSYSLTLTLPFIGSINIPFIDILTLSDSNTPKIYPYIIINTSNLQGKVYILKSILKARYTLPEGKEDWEYQGLANIPSNYVYYESDLFDVGIDMPLGSTNVGQARLNATIAALKATAKVAALFI